MASAAESDTQEASERRRERPKKSKRPKPPIPTSEAEIDAPDRLTLSMVGVMAVVTIALWLFARMACNYHPPRETRRPRAVKTEELARDPKDAALEMQQRLLQLDFAGAAELSKGTAASDVEKAKAQCATNAQDCAMKRKQLEKHVESVAALLERQPTTATARVTSFTPSGKQVSIVKLERDGSIWKVASRVPDDGTFKPAPAGTMNLMSPHGSASGAPAASGSAPAGSVVAVPSGGPTIRLVPKPSPGTPAPAASQ